MRRSLRHRWRIAICFTIVIAAFAASTPGASALDLYHIRGLVKDALGRPLPGVTIYDGDHATTTAADGSYSLGESSTGTFRLTASRTDLVANVKNVQVTLPIDTTVDFTMLYRIVSALDDRFISTASGEAERALSITSFAPQPNGSTSGSSCVKVTDSRTGTTEPATFVGLNPDGSSAWSYDLSVPQSTAEGTYTLTANATECSIGTALSPPANVSYLIDNTTPAIGTLLPLDGANTAFAQQPLLAKITDNGGAGVDPTRIIFQLTDSTTGSTTIIQNVSYNASTGVASTPAQAMVLGHVYTAAVAAFDRAGNANGDTHKPAYRGGGFLSISATPAAGSASIPATSCTVSQSIDSTGMKTATCPDVLLRYAESSLSTSGAYRGSEVAFVDHTASLAQATITVSIAGAPVPLPAYRDGDSAWQPRTTPLTAAVASAAMTQQTYTVQGQDRNIGTLTTKVPAAAGDSATLQMSPTTTTSSLEACANPSASYGPRSCVPDPLRSRYTVILASTVPNPEATAQAQVAAASGTLLELLDLDGAQRAYRAYLPLQAAAALASDTRVLSLTRDGLEGHGGYTFSSSRRLLVQGTKLPSGACAFETSANDPAFEEFTDVAALNDLDFCLAVRHRGTLVSEPTRPAGVFDSIDDSATSTAGGGEGGAPMAMSTSTNKQPATTSKLSIASHGGVHHDYILLDSWIEDPPQYKVTRARDYVDWYPTPTCALSSYTATSGYVLNWLTNTGWRLTHYNFVPYFSCQRINSVSYSYFENKFFCSYYVTGTWGVSGDYFTTRTRFEPNAAYGFANSGYGRGVYWVIEGGCQRMLDYDFSVTHP